MMSLVSGILGALLGLIAGQSKNGASKGRSSTGVLTGRRAICRHRHEVAVHARRARPVRGGGGTMVAGVFVWQEASGVEPPCNYKPVRGP